MASALDYFSRIYCINLKERADRREQMRAEFQRVGWPADRVTWFEAVRPPDAGKFDSIGARGCFFSHLGVLRDAATSGVPRILLLEDDVDFVRGFPERMSEIVNALESRQWDMFYGGGRYERSQACDIGGIASVAPDEAIGTAHFVAFQSPVFERLPDYLEDQASREPGDPRGGPMHVDGTYAWARRDWSLTTFVAEPEVCFQRPSRSDIYEFSKWDRRNLTSLIAPARAIARKLRRWRP